MNSLAVGVCFCAALFMVQSDQNCEPTEFLHSNGSCIACPVCGPGEQLSQDCGFGDGGDGVCVLCEKGKFSSDVSVDPCRRCTQCNMLNRLERTACSATNDALCGQCLPGYYELRSITGVVELPCVSCYRHDTIHKECLLFTAQASKTESDITVPRQSLKQPEEKKVKEKTYPMVLIGSATASSIFLIALLLWASLLAAERYKQIPEFCHEPEGLQAAAGLQHTPLFSHTEKPVKQSKASSLTSAPAEDTSRGLNSLSNENEVHPTSIVINVTTTLTPSSQEKENITKKDECSRSYVTEQMEQQLQTIWETAQGHSIEVLDYDSVQDLSLLLDSVENGGMFRKLAQSLGVPPQTIAHLQGFQDLFQYLRTSTYTLLPQLAQAAALMPNPEAVARIHKAVMNKWPLRP